MERVQDKFHMALIEEQSPRVSIPVMERVQDKFHMALIEEIRYAFISLCAIIPIMN